MPPSSFSSCYYPNGDLATAGDIPCNTSGDGPCCPLNWNCESNGLCSLANQQYYGRYTCTDKTWQSSSCPQICTYGLTASGDEAVLQCESGSYCCDTNRPDPGCCVTSTSRFHLSSLQWLFPAGSPGGGTDNGGSSGGGGGSGSGDSASSSVQQAAPSSSKAATTPSTPPPSVTPPSVAPSVTPNVTPQTVPPQSSTTLSSTPPSSQSSTSTSSSSSTSSPVSSSPIISIITSVITKGGTSNTVITSQSSNTAVPITAASSSKKPIGTIVGPVVGVLVAVLATIAFFLWRHKKRSRRNHPPPRHLQAAEAGQPSYFETKAVVEAPPYAGKHELEGSQRLTATSPSTAPPSYRGSTLIGTAATQNPQGPPSSELHGSPTVGMSRDSRGSELMFSHGTGHSALPRQAELKGVRQGGHPSSELPGDTYHPYRPPGWSG